MLSKVVPLLLAAKNEPPTQSLRKSKAFVESLLKVSKISRRQTSNKNYFVFRIQSNLYDGIF